MRFPNELRIPNYFLTKIAERKVDGLRGRANFPTSGERVVSNPERAERRRRSLIAAVVVVASVAVFAVVGGTGFAGSSVGAGQYQYGGLGQYQYGKRVKVVVCHKRHHTVVISPKAWQAHKRHGDTVGWCVRVKAKKHGHGHKGHQSRSDDSNDKGKNHGKGHDKGGKSKDD